MSVFGGGCASKKRGSSVEKLFKQTVLTSVLKRNRASETSDRCNKRRKTDDLASRVQRRRPPTVVTTADRKVFNVRNYRNIVNDIDGLRHQLPSVCSVTRSKAIVDRLFRDSTQDGRTIVTDCEENDTVDLSRIATFCRLYNDENAFASSSIKEVVEFMLTPLLKIATNGIVEDSAKTVSGFVSATKRKWTISAVLSNAFKFNQFATNFDRLLVDCNEACSTNVVHSASKGKNTCVDKLRTYVSTMKRLLTSELDNAFDCPDENVCDCYHRSHRVIVYSSVNETSMSSTSKNVANVFYEELFKASTVPTVLLDASWLLCGVTDSDRFRKDFVLNRVEPHPSDKNETWRHVSKAFDVVNKGFYSRLFALHSCLYVIVNWLWSRQRSCHSVLHGERVDSSIGDHESSPVTVMVSSELYPLLHDAPTMTLVELNKSAKCVVQRIV